MSCVVFHYDRGKEFLKISSELMFLPLRWTLAYKSEGPTVWSNLESQHVSQLLRS